MWDNSGLIYLNSGCRKHVPVSLGLLVQKPGFILKVLAREQRQAIRTAYARYLETGKFDEEVKVLSEDGSSCWFRVKINRCFDRNGNFSHHLGIAEEISIQKQRMAEMEVTCEKAQTANFNKTAFLANMSHEIRSPLNGILGFSELLTDPDLPLHERERYIDIIKNNGNALLTILTDIIDISKLESGKMKILEKEFLPAELLRELQLQFNNDPLVTQKGLIMRWLISDDMAGVRLISDPYRFRQIMVNLLTNALKYSNQGRIEVVAERWEDLAVFWVKDTGVGIAEESLPVIFDRFRQVGKADANLANGFGLGLAICKALVELLGGNIWAESRAGHGSVFYFTIPFKTPKLTEMNNSNTTETAFPYDWKGRTILIAEDIDFNFLYIEAVLRRTGARVLWAQNGREAIEMVKVNPGIDIALMDIHMPIMNGYDATREIMKIRPDLPVIAQTAFVLPDDVKACYAAGCAGYLAKPIRREQLLNTLTDYFEKIDQNANEEAGNMPVYRSKIS
jgi:signal transduction histidine kinase/ActR/RegA family two-component response regulator